MADYNGYYPGQSADDSGEPNQDQLETLLQQRAVPTTARPMTVPGQQSDSGPMRPTPYEEGGVTGGVPEGTKYATQPSGNDATVDMSKWDTDGYSKPGYTASNYGAAPSGWDATKWADANHQTPKYVVGRILQEASGGTGFLKDPKQREAAIASIQKAYPGATFNGKDTITMPDGGKVDIFRGAGNGEYGTAWQPVTGPGGKALPNAGGAPGAAGGGSGYGALVQSLMARYGSHDNPYGMGSSPYGLGGPEYDYMNNPMYQQMLQRVMQGVPR